MRLSAITMIFLIFPMIACAAAVGPSSFPYMQIATDKPVYSAGESGSIYISINPDNKFDEAEIEVVVSSPEGVIIDGAIFQTAMPQKTIINPEKWQTQQILVSEGIYTEEFVREIKFTIPQNAPKGTYEVHAVLVAGADRLENNMEINIINNESVEYIVFVYILAFIIIGLMFYHMHIEKKG